MKAEDVDKIMNREMLFVEIQVATHRGSIRALADFTDVFISDDIEKYVERAVKALTHFAGAAGVERIVDSGSQRKRVSVSIRTVSLSDENAHGEWVGVEYPWGKKLDSMIDDVIYFFKRDNRLSDNLEQRCNIEQAIKKV